MARIIEVQKYQGFSSELKPENPGEGSEYHVIDTGEEFVFFNGMWEQDLRRINAIQKAAVI